MKNNKEYYNSKISMKANVCIRDRQAVVRLQKYVLAVVFIVCISLFLLFGTGISTFANPSKDNPTYYKYYKSVCIEKGDTLWSIAGEQIGGLDIDRREYIKELCTLNNLNMDGDIQAGDYIIISYYSDEIK